MTGYTDLIETTSESRGDPVRERRGFALYVGLSETKARESGIELGEMVDALKRALFDRIPLAESHALAVVASIGMIERDLELVLRATVERPSSETATTPHPLAPIPSPGVTVDFARHRALVNGRDAGLTFKEFALLQVLVFNDGKTLSREQLRSAIITPDEAEVNDRTIDVHVRRLRIKFGDYPDVIRTVHSRGYRFDPRSDVTVLRSSTPSPDLI
jgi:DNA-binding winged helix-turn-helix (wHTH) protein